MTKKEKTIESIRKEIGEIINWAYKSNFATVFSYNPSDQSTKPSDKANEKIEEFINKFIKL